MLDFCNVSQRAGKHGRQDQRRGPLLPGDKISSHANQTVMNQVAGGYCEGVGLDWIRRALLPKMRPDGSAPRRLNFAGDKPQRDLRHADAQLKF